MKRTIKDYFVIGFKGMAMGAADVVPGVSGGTIAFISGIYEELLNSISSINLDAFKTLKNQGFSVAWKQINGNFLLSLFTGILLSVLTLAKIISWLLEAYPILLWSFFFGLVVASIWYIAKQISQWNILGIFLFILGAVLAFYITTLNPLVSQNSSPLFLFLAGALAICAMILPGISGSFILVLLGAYKPILEALNSRDIGIIALVGIGAVFGLVSFSRVLKWLFTNYKNYTLMLLTGFILGSLNKIWPWKKVLTYRTNSHGEQVPFKEMSVSPFSFEGDPQIFHAIVLCSIGFGLLIGLEKLAVKKR
ncbi:DUF368 domain-containing protein [Tenacibaculum sp. SG-28]|uniref:DUF368 domain-containing protein n=1 Tax=Tenacibaculum sp. SG-28 TaxID=754426 RepID=UPI000CF4B00E|nr:DUF368 domain-containing protein [Tenacibaculum sp. SG-28]PQJ22901.1 DUF368 domain-containing protein [Tenacibaculum sp. SG-28]